MGQLLKPFELFIGWMIAQIYEYIPSVGIAIILVTMVVMLLIYPLTHKQTKSQVAMQALQPKLKELQAKYKDDKQKLSEETMALYKEAGVNPLGGCLPMVIQMPFFFSIFRVIRNIQDFVEPHTKLFKDLCSPVKTAKLCTASVSQLRSAGFSASEAEELAQKLPVSKHFFGLQLSTSLKQASDQGVWVITAYVILMGLMGLMVYISMHRQSKFNPNTPSQFKMLKYLIPLGSIFSGIFLPAGTNLYILTSSTWRACQQEFLFHKVIKPHRENEEKKSKKLDELNETPIGYYKPGQARQKRKKK